jgi:hypothetical protein
MKKRQKTSKQRKKIRIGEEAEKSYGEGKCRRSDC